MNKHLEKKWKEDKLEFKRITNNDLDCKDCKFKLDDKEIFGNTSKCKLFETVKPSSILKGEKCEVKEKDERRSKNN